MIASDTDLDNCQSDGGWLSLHVFAPPSLQPALLRRLAPLAARAEQWFFIHYAEHGPHLRLRIRGEQRMCAETLADMVREAIVAGATSIVPARYTREQTRYGGADAMKQAERVFCTSSAVACGLWTRRTARPAMLAYAAVLAAAVWRLVGANGRDLARRYAAGLALVVRDIDPGAMPPRATPRPGGIRAAREWCRIADAMATGADFSPLPDGSVYLNHVRDHLAGVTNCDSIESIASSHVHMTCNRLGLSVVDELLISRALSAESLRGCSA